MSKKKPMLEQYEKIKGEYKDSILLFRLGGFYEIFYKDAYIVHKMLGLKVTARNVGLKESIPMCGIPVSYVDKYVDRIVEIGYKVAVCNQVEGISEIHGVVNRKVTRVKEPKINKYSEIQEEEYTQYLDIFNEQKENKEEVMNKKVYISVIKELQEVAIDEITPQQAITLLYKWKSKVGNA